MVDKLAQALSMNQLEESASWLVLRTGYTDTANVGPASGRVAQKGLPPVPDIQGRATRPLWPLGFSRLLVESPSVSVLCGSRHRSQKFVSGRGQVGSVPGFGSPPISICERGLRRSAPGRLRTRYGFGPSGYAA